MMALFKPRGYAAFGSFHSDNPGELILQGAEYKPPARHVRTEQLFDSSSAPPGFGREMKEHFFVDPSWCFINHGAFGGACRVAMKSSQAWAEYCEAQPLRYIDRELFPLMVHSLREASALLGVRATQMAFVPNATYALTATISSLLTGPDSPCALSGPTDCVFFLDIGYGSVKKMLLQACEATGAKVVVGTVRFPLSTPQELVQQVVTQIAALGRSCKLAVLDHITSNSGLVLPIQELVTACKAIGVPVLVDGAHGFASQELEVEVEAEAEEDGAGGGAGAEAGGGSGSSTRSAAASSKSPGRQTWLARLLDSGAVAYITNCHKWACSSKGLGLLVLSHALAPQPPGTPAAATCIRAPVISHGYGSGFTNEWMWDGARDYSAAVSFPDLLAWWRWVGGLQAARDYSRKLLTDAVALLTAAWGTSTQAPMAFYSHMACVQLPPCCLPPGAAKRIGDADAAEGAAVAAAATAGAEDYTYACTSTHGKMLQDALHYGFSIECPVKTLPGPRTTEMRSYVRISAFVYNTIEDFQHLADSVLRIRWDADGNLAVAAAPGS